MKTTSFKWDNNIRSDFFGFFFWLANAGKSLYSRNYEARCSVVYPGSRCVCRCRLCLFCYAIKLLCNSISAPMRKLNTRNGLSTALAFLSIGQPYFYATKLSYHRVLSNRDCIMMAYFNISICMYFGGKEFIQRIK